MSKKTIVKISNIKLSGLLTHSFVSEFLTVDVYKCDNSRISFYCNHLHFSVLGKLKKSINITGVRSIGGIGEIQNIFSAVYIHRVVGIKGSEITKLKVDSISLTCKTHTLFYRKFKKKSKLLRIFLKDNNFNLRTYHTFSGICLKKIKSYSIIFFSTGSVNAFGFKTVEEFFSVLKSFYKYLSQENKNKIKKVENKKCG